MLSKDRLKTAGIMYFSSALLYGLGLLLYETNNYYSGFLNPLTRKILLYFYIVYLFAAPVIFLLRRNNELSDHKPAIFFVVLRRVFGSFFGRGAWGGISGFSSVEKTAVLFLLVKLFFIPLMLNFFVGNAIAVRDIVANLGGFQFDLDNITYRGYNIALVFIFAVDTLFFAFGYFVESKFLNNKVRSVEPTFLGWAVAIVCYPPFNIWFQSYVPWGAEDYVRFSTPVLTFAARFIIILLLLVYLWATLSLGTRCSNLTNRGIVGGGAYGFIRHPAYICKNLSWWIMLIPVMTLASFIGMAVWSFIYFLRAITEERHLGADPEYQAYCQKTRYRFIPFVV